MRDWVGNRLCIILAAALLIPLSAIAQTDDCISNYSTSLCSICGDGLCAPGENCADDCLPAACGDGLCEEGEVCSDDCGDSCEAICGDLLCSLGEDSTSCADDCAPVCGDSCCEEGEDCTEDCGLCEPSCGDGDIEPDETCDDGGTNSGDGCDANCQIEADYLCNGEPSACVFDCAVLDCDDGDPCTGDICDPQQGCLNPEIADCSGLPSPPPSPSASPDGEDPDGEGPDEEPEEDSVVDDGTGWSCSLGQRSKDAHPSEVWKSLIPPLGAARLKEF